MPTAPDGGGGYECRQHQVYDQETPKYPFGALAESDDECQGETFGKLGFDQHGCQHEAQDVQPHDGVSELRQCFFLCGYAEQHRAQDEQQGSQIVRYGFRHPQDEAGYEYGKHSVVGPDEAFRAEYAKAFLGCGGQGARVQVVNEAYMAEPTDPHEGYDSQRTSKARHPNFELGFLHLGQFLNLVIVHVQRIESLLRLGVSVCCHYS